MMCAKLTFEMRNYDLSDSTDLELLKSDFEAFKPRDWQDLIDFSMDEKNEGKVSYEERGCLISVRKKALSKSLPAYRLMVWALNIADKVEEMMEP